MENKMVMHDGKVMGAQVSQYGIHNGYLDYRALAGIVGDMILNNTLMTVEEIGEWEVVCGQDYEEDEEYGGITYYDVYQTYIISEQGYEFLSWYTNEIVYYNNQLDLYLWGVTHFGTSWDYVLTNIKLVGGEK